MAGRAEAPALPAAPCFKATVYIIINCKQVLGYLACSVAVLFRSGQGNAPTDPFAGEEELERLLAEGGQDLSVDRVCKVCRNDAWRCLLPRCTWRGVHCFS
jgi:hypothetical protein